MTDRIRYRALYSGRRWQLLRARVVKAHPFCMECDTGFAEIVDHVVPAGVAVAQARASGLFIDRNAGFYFVTNVQSLCRECHWLKTMRDKAHTGPWADTVAAEQSASTKKIRFII